MSHKKVHSLAWQFTEKFDYQGQPQETSCTGDEHSPVLENPSTGYWRGSHCFVFIADYLSDRVQRVLSFLTPRGIFQFFSTLAQLIRMYSTL